MDMFRIRAIASLSLVLFVATAAIAQDSPLTDRQAGVAARYQRLEELLLRLADVEAAENPERAALLRQASKQSRDTFVLQQLRSAAESLRNEKYSDALTNQDAASEGLVKLLKLLTSEDRANRIRDEKERLAKLIKGFKRLERTQRGTRARTENGSDLDQLQDEQESIADRGESLKDELSEENEAERDEQNKAAGEEGDPNEDSENKPSGEGKSGEDSESEKESEGGSKSNQESEKENEGADSNSDPNSEQDAKDSDPKESGEKDSKPSEGGEQKDSQQGEPSEQGSQSQQGSESQQGQQQQQGSDSQPQQPQTPQQRAEQQLQKAIQRMRSAEQDLEQSKREEAIEDQLAAEESLRQAIDELEQILRQLREEEMQRELARLESRLKKMAAMQSKVYDDTVLLAATPKPQRNRQTDLKAGDLAFEEKKITVEADRAMLLLREEGSSVAFPEVVEQIRDDTERIAQRLSKSQIDAVTQGIQQDVLAAIEEMVQALQQAQRDLEKQKQEGKGPPQQAGQPGEQPLVDAIAELKLIRTMETRIKSTTQRYAELLQSDQSSAQELLPLLKNLSERQNRLYKVTRDLVMRRNK